LPIIADVHFSAARAIESIEAGAVKIRINPGNIKDPNDIIRIIDAAKANNTAIRAGINEASIRDLKKGDVPGNKRVGLMLKEMKKYVKLFDARGFTNLVLSAKSADILRTVEINQAIAKTFHCPIHLGLTHAGLAEDAAIPSAVALGILLHEGIGDTVRVSIAGNPNQEVKIARQILKSLGLYQYQEAKLTVCPTCGRCQIDVVKLAKSVRKIMKDVKIPLNIAVMGCIVNGPGEAKDADLAICAANKKGYLYRNGQKLATVPEEKLLEALAEELDSMGAFEIQR
jgi:(E)-4-hydroxy-3-methylbut-2-enyl-diphosphate synthase